jgi:serine protease inhibitor
MWDRLADTAAAVDSVNKWISKATAGRITSTLQDIPQDAKLLLGRQYNGINSMA